jgi:tryptophan-rich sensory protein
MKTRDIFALIVALALPQIAGSIGALFTFSAIPTWYATLIRPELAPPNWVFGPVWTILFLLMGFASFLVWSAYASASHDNKKAIQIGLALFGIQLVLNTFWSILFFGQRNPGGALIEIVFLWIAILGTIIAFYKISKPAAWLLVPYILWVSFAGYLNFAIWYLN